MKTDKFLKESHPEAKKKLRLPDQLELVMEDGTVYRVRSFFAAEQQMGAYSTLSPSKRSIGRTESRPLLPYIL